MNRKLKNGYLSRKGWSFGRAYQGRFRHFRAELSAILVNGHFSLCRPVRNFGGLEVRGVYILETIKKFQIRDPEVKCLNLKVLFSIFLFKSDLKFEIK